MAEPFTNEINAPGGKVLSARTIQGGTFNFGDGPKAPVQLWVDVPPLPPHEVVGRAAVLAELRAKLAAPEGRAALEGLPGVGKTTAAAALARDEAMKAHFRAGVLWAALGPRGAPDAALRRWGDALGVDLGAAPSALAMAGKVSVALQQRTQGAPVLLVVDDVWTEEQAEPFRSIAFPGCAHLVTTRSHDLAAWFTDGVTRVDELPDEEAEAFVATRCAGAREADPEGFPTLVRAAGGLPLALTLIGEELGRHAGQASWVKKAIERLAATEARLALEVKEGRPAVAGVSPSLRAIVETSVDALAAEDRAAFEALGAFAAKPADFGRDAARAVWDVGDERADERLRLLVARGLLEVAGEGRFTLHQVLADVARARLGDERGPRARHAAFYRGRMESDKEDWRRIEQELLQIRCAWGWIDREDDAASLLAYVDAIQPFHDRRGLPGERLAWAERGLAAAKKVGRPRDVGRSVNRVGSVCHDLGDTTRAKDCYEEALQLRRDTGDKEGEGETLDDIGRLHGDQGDWAGALASYKKALPLHRAAGRPRNRAITLANIGIAHRNRGRSALALKYDRLALHILEAHGGDPVSLATLRSRIGEVHYGLGDLERAMEYYEQALPLHKAAGDRPGEALTSFNMGVLLHSRGKLDEAIAHMERAVEIGEAIQHPGLATSRAELARMRAERDAPAPAPAPAPVPATAPAPARPRPPVFYALLALAVAVVVIWLAASR